MDGTSEFIEGTIVIAGGLSSAGLGILVGCQTEKILVRVIPQGSAGHRSGSCLKGVKRGQSSTLTQGSSGRRSQGWFREVVRQIRPVAHPQFSGDPFEPHRRPTMVATVHPIRKTGSPLFSVEWFCGKFFALEARMKVAGGKPGETRRTGSHGNVLRAPAGRMK